MVGCWVTLTLTLTVTLTLTPTQVPNMFPNDEKSAVIEMVRPIAAKQGLKLETPLELWAFFTKRCREMLHVSLCFSPIGGAFRDRLRQYDPQP